jgi:hypothetical protein
LIERRQHSSTPDVRLFRAAEYDTDHYLMLAKVRKRLRVSKQTTHRVHMKRSSLKKLTVVEIKGSIMLKSQIGLQLWRTYLLDADVYINRAWETITQNTKISTKQNLSYYELKKY